MHVRAGERETQKNTRVLAHSLHRGLLRKIDDPWCGISLVVVVVLRLLWLLAFEPGLVQFCLSLPLFGDVFQCVLAQGLSFRVVCWHSLFHYWNNSRRR